jgi:hypothetical protein
MLITAKSKLVIFVAGMILLSLSMSPALADSPKIIHVAGKAEILEAKGETATQATVGAQLKPGSKIVVVGKGTVEIKVGKESINATAGDDTQLEYKGRSLFKGVERFTLQKGRALFKIKKGDKLDVKTPHVVASVRGTEFLAHADDNNSSISVISGRVHTRDQHGNNLDLQSDSYAVINEQGFVEVGKGRHVNSITGKAKTEKGVKVEADKKSSADRADVAKEKARKEGKNKADSQKVTSDKSRAGRGEIEKSKAEKADSGGGKSSSGKSGGENAGGGNSGGSSAGGGNAGGGKSDSGNAGGKDSSGGKSDSGNSGGGNSDKGNSSGGNSDKGNSGNGNAGNGNQGKGNSDKENPGIGNSK